MRRFDGKVVIITGSTSGIGAATARRCAAEGARVLVHGLNADEGATVVREIGSDVASLCIEDLTDVESPARIVAAALRTFGRIDAICNNAALIARGDLAATDAALFDRVMTVNARAPLLMIRAAVEHLKATRGAVVNIGSVNGFGGESNQLAYAMSKGALLTMSRNLADALGRDGVRVNHLVVGWVLSENERRLKQAEGMPAGWSDHPPPTYVPSGRMTSPDEVAGAAAYWLSDESRPFSGGAIELEQYPMLGRNPPKE
jgi:NAD(P)-dependent dehydrogenase (short-subunit alcohol dehydrogenase family)